MRVAIYNQHFRTLGGGERRSLALAAHLAHSHEVTIIAEAALPRDELKKLFDIEIDGIRWLTNPNWGQDGRPTDEFDVFINNSHGSALKNPARFGIYMCMFPQAEEPDLSSYQVITANSSFTARWIAKKWGLTSRVVYSASQDMGPPTAKQNVILNVGRFFAPDGSNHHKHQRVLLQSFINMRRSGLSDWELYLIGNCSDGKEDRAYLADLRREADGHPVIIETGVDFQVLRDRYRRAALYWHATGFGVDEEKEPSAHEHFGMTIIEGMSAGAVPLAIRGGGPREIIREGVDGFLWSSPEELQEKSLRLLKPNFAAFLGLACRRRRMARRAMARSRQFMLRAFLARMDGIIAEGEQRARETNVRIQPDVQN
jgi:glycosyltransferase involved in cell wall biosynthesis